MGWCGITLDRDTRLRVGRAIGKDESEVAWELMAQLKARGHPDAPPAIATDGPVVDVPGIHRIAAATTGWPSSWQEQWAPHVQTSNKRPSR
jgi:hypothetical protein